MKKALTKALLFAMTIVTLAAIIPLSANASTSNKQKVYSFLTNEMKLNSAAACGILANIERESDFNPRLVIRDSNGLQSGGLCQWNGGRFSNLKRYCERNGYSYLSVEGQMNYLKYELSQNSYDYIYDFLRTVTNNSDGAYDAGYYWCYYFEIPSNRGVKAKQRGSNAKNEYWPQFGNKIPSKPTLSFSKKATTYDMDNAIGIKWTSGGKNCTSYRLYVAKKDTSTGKYDWTNCKTYSIGSSKKSYTIAKNSLKTGTYKIKLRAFNDTTGEYRDSNTITCKIKCETHSYSTKITKQPTFEKKGTKLLTCKQCGTKVTKSVSALTLSDFESMKMTTPKLSSASAKSIKLKWDKFAGATGYCIYQQLGGKWQLLGKTSGLSYTVKSLKPSTEYKFRIRAYAKDGSETYYTSYSSTLVTATKTANAPTIALSRGTNKATVSWNKVSGADGYQIYVATGENSKNYKRVASVGAKTTSYTLTGLKKNQYYNFKVRPYVKCSNDTYVYGSFSKVKYIIAR
ncbi:MAG: fibronectin type III domain-containing protein [Clostridia bacterium]|nr:fibronectin type III domain-containing protein [Clostridia bacterium]